MPGEGACCRRSRSRCSCLAETLLTASATAFPRHGESSVLFLRMSSSSSTADEYSRFCVGRGTRHHTSTASVRRMSAQSHSPLITAVQCSASSLDAERQHRRCEYPSTVGSPDYQPRSSHPARARTHAQRTTTRVCAVCVRTCVSFVCACGVVSSHYQIEYPLTPPFNVVKVSFNTPFCLSC
jgi:hypothetical protein